MASIASISPAAFDDGKPVTLTGSGFGASQGSVLIGGVAQNVNTWSDTSITFTTVRGSQSLGACRVDVVGGGTESVTITGSGFGVAPNVVLYRTLDGTPGDTVTTSAPTGEIGAFSAATMKYASDGAQGFDSSTQRSLEFTAATSFQRYRIATSLKVPSGKYAPGRDNTGLETWSSDSGWKPVWAMLNAGSNSNQAEADLCIPTHIGNGAHALSGNTVQTGERFWDYETSSAKPSHHWSWDAWNTYQLICDVGADPITTAVNQVGYFTSENVSGSVKTTGTRSYAWNFPGYRDPAPTDLIDAANARIGVVRYNSFARTSNADSSLTQALYRDLYIAAESSDGAGDYRQACFLGNASTFATCTRIKMKVASAWSNTSVTIAVSSAERLIYTHAFVQKADGSAVGVAI